MTQTTNRPARRPGDRLPRQGDGSVGRGREIRIGALGVLGIAVLIIGIPVALSVFVGYPLPRSAPSKDWLTQSVTATLIIKILACLVWLLWAHFAVCIIAEWRALRHGRLPGDVPLGGGSQMLARRLVAAALLLAGTATAFGNLSTGSSAASPTMGQAVVQSAQHPGLDAAQQQQVRANIATANAEAHQAAEAQVHHAAASQGTKTYTVQPADGRHHDSLWDIAHRTLGDGLRYKEIFALNKDRVQSDGSKLHDANLIRPGWQLHLPADATGPGVHTAHARAAAKPIDTPAPVTPAPSTPSAPASPHAPAAHATTHPSAAAATSVRAAGRTNAGSSLDTDLLGGGLMLAGIALALSARRGPYSTATEDEQALTAAADLGLALSVDRALRNLAAARNDQERGLPQPVLAWASVENISLALAGGDMTDPPSPWRADSDTSWTCSPAEIRDHDRLADTAAPFPGLLSVGRDNEYEVFVDFEQASGLISVGGDAERGRDLVTSLAAQAVTCAWSDGAKATLVGFSDGEQIAALDTHSVEHVNSLATVLGELERRQADLARLQDSLGVDGVLNGRQSRRTGAWAPHFIVLSGSPTDDEARRLTQLVGNGRSPFVVLVVGDLTHAAWRFVIDADRNLDLGVLGATARSHQLDRNSMLQLIDALRSANETAAQKDAQVAALAPQAALADARNAADDAAAPSVRAERPAAGSARATVSLLGPVTIEAAGALEVSRRDLATEIVVAVALSPAGIPEVVLRSAIWPRGVSDEVFAAAMHDAAQWLGTDAAGLPALRATDGRWLLGTSVRIDWEDMQLAVQAAQGHAELDALRHCVSLFHGEAFSGTPAGRYGWLSFRRSARDAAVLATSVVRRAASLLGHAGQIDQAEATLRRGLVLVPTAEPIWRDLLEIAGRRGPAAAATVADEMYTALRAHRIWAQPETDALVSQLAPGRKESQTA